MATKAATLPTGSVASDMGQDTAEKLNLRTCGRDYVPSQAPKVKKERVQSVPTIPSKFEVTLYRGNREYKGFCSRSMRFEALRPSEGPGPGQYGQQKSFHEENDEKACWGIRGTGGFASRSKRFGIRSMPQLPPPGLGCPGPGAYDALSALRLAKEPKDFNQVKASAVFNPSKTTGKGTVAIEPGPGQYDPKLLPDSREAAAAQAAFRSQSTRIKSGTVMDDKPGPGEYWTGMEKPIGSIPEYLQGLDHRNANFKESSRPHIVKIHKDLPSVTEESRGVLGDFGDEVSKQCLGTNGAAAAMPGPGAYTQDRDRIWKGNLVGVSGHSSFQPGAKRTDWAPEEVGLMPGPGRYDPKKASNVNLTTAISAFVSSSERGKHQFHGAPGPAYYSPKLPKHKSFRLKSSEFVA